MKKVITVCLFTFALFLSHQSVVAQNSKLDAKKEINAEASTKTEALRKYVKFDNNQRDEIYIAFRTYGQEMVSSNNKSISKEEVTKYKNRLDDKIKSILNDDQYARYKAYLSEN
ncbi:hypothetical protein [Winogradskyella bathintestinalis]|uniref:Peptidylprolyl isomerase n=1 Tax=Winogradskyella bathintestinalis TaxID=3035208 RepID=A0ABT7ZXV0_9FLAO|nr:hypothetical protein [Winogradskyella bathintestinalis]MDN3493814.1 hypothetical protein [Winogradskyella bathintestinalis]